MFRCARAHARKVSAAKLAVVHIYLYCMYASLLEQSGYKLKVSANLLSIFAMDSERERRTRDANTQQQQQKTRYRAIYFGRRAIVSVLRNRFRKGVGAALVERQRTQQWWIIILLCRTQILFSRSYEHFCEATIERVHSLLVRFLLLLASLGTYTDK